MSDKATGPAGAAGTVPTADQPSKIRNVVLVGHSGAGKTTLVEALLVATGAIPRAGRVEDGTTTTDFEDAEVRHQRSVSLALAPVEHDGVKINLLDAPGYADFTTPISGLYQCSSATHGGGGVTGIPALLCTRRILGDRRRESRRARLRAFSRGSGRISS